MVCVCTKYYEGKKNVSYFKNCQLKDQLEKLEKDQLENFKS